MDGSSELQAKVKEIAKQWETYANIKFNFDQSDASAVVRITFEGSGCYTTRCGNQLLLDTDTSKHTMCLAGAKSYFLSPSTENNRNFQRKVLHEFGHILGLQHEHQSPNSSLDLGSLIDLDKYSVSQGLSKSSSAYQLNRIAMSIKYKATSFDDKSIMLYAIPSNLFKDPDTAPRWTFNSELSDLDKSGIAAMYPKSGGLSDARMMDPLVSNIVLAAQSDVVSPLAKTTEQPPGMAKSQSVFWRQLVL